MFPDYVVVCDVIVNKVGGIVSSVASAFNCILPDKLIGM